MPSVYVHPYIIIDEGKQNTIKILHYSAKLGFINFQKAVQGDGSGKQKLKCSNTFRQLLTAVAAFMLEHQLEIHVICTEIQNIMREAPKERGNGMAGLETHTASPLQPVTQRDNFHTTPFPVIPTVWEEKVTSVSI